MTRDGYPYWHARCLEAEALLREEFGRSLCVEAPPGADIGECFCIDLTDPRGKPTCLPCRARAFLAPVGSPALTQSTEPQGPAVTPSAARRAPKWKRKGRDWCIGGGRVRGGAAIYAGLGRWLPTAWWTLDDLWVAKKDVGELSTAMEAVEAWLSTREAAKPRKKPADGLASRPLKRGRRKAS